ASRRRLAAGGRTAHGSAGPPPIKGKKAKEFTGRPSSGFSPPGGAARRWPEEELERAAAEGRFEHEGWRVRKDGSRFWANVVLTALRDEEGRLRGFSKGTRGLTEPKRAGEAPPEPRPAPENGVQGRTPRPARTHQ